MSSKGDEDRRVAVVTGGAGVIGGAIAARLAPDHTVVVLDRAGDVIVDLGDPDDVRRAAGLVLDRHGRCTPPSLLRGRTKPSAALARRIRGDHIVQS